MTCNAKTGGASAAINPATWHPVARHYDPASGAGRALEWLAQTIIGAFSRLSMAIRIRRQRKLDRSAVQYMLGLEDHMLRDIGLTRGDVEWANRLPLSVNAAVELELRSLINRKEWKR
ncbi:MAG: DUF1127 domain-containing protein [Phyllobacteriaceae bacterium]|nr:DUF1127 domain-containing protein [Phyllobacteriaceae bacterium]